MKKASDKSLVLCLGLGLVASAHALDLATPVDVEVVKKCGTKEVFDPNRGVKVSVSAREVSTFKADAVWFSDEETLKIRSQTLLTGTEADPHAGRVGKFLRLALADNTSIPSNYGYRGGKVIGQRLMEFLKEGLVEKIELAKGPCRDNQGFGILSITLLGGNRIRYDDLDLVASYSFHSVNETIDRARSVKAKTEAETRAKAEAKAKAEAIRPRMSNWSADDAAGEEPSKNNVSGSGRNAQDGDFRNVHD